VWRIRSWIVIGLLCGWKTSSVLPAPAVALLNADFKILELWQILKNGRRDIKLAFLDQHQPGWSLGQT
jgi:hypothetical protein